MSSFGGQSPVDDEDADLMRDLDDMKEFLGRQDSDDGEPSLKLDEIKKDFIGRHEVEEVKEEFFLDWPAEESGIRRTRSFEQKPDTREAIDHVREELDRLDVLNESPVELPKDALAFLEEAASKVRGLGGEEVSDYAAGFPLAKAVKTPPPGKHKSDAKRYGLYDTGESPEPGATKPAVEPADDEGTPMSYKEFLARLMLPQSAELVSHVRAFVVRILDEARERDDALRARKPDAGTKRRRALAELPERCSKFFDAAEAHFEDHPSWKSLGHAGVASARSALEKYVMTKLGAWAFEACRDDRKDSHLQERCRALATFVTPKHLDIKPGLCDNEVVLHIARDELRRMDAVKAPADKVDCVVRCASIIFSALNLSRAGKSSAGGLGDDDDDDPAASAAEDDDDDKKVNNKSKRVHSESRAGADDFLPVFIYVVLHADAPRLFSNCDYIQEFHNPAALMSKAGYCFVNLRSAIEFLLHLEGQQIGMDQVDFQNQLQAALDSQRPPPR